MKDEVARESSVGQELSDRELHRQQIEALFRAKPLEDISAETFKAITPHYQQRISECRRKHGMRIENRPIYTTSEKGRQKRLDGAYRFLPYEPLGRSADTPQADVWPVPGAPYEEPWSLKP